jgi:hypothetical protein
MNHPTSETSVRNNGDDNIDLQEEKGGLYIHKDLVVNNEEALTPEELDVGTRTTIRSLEKTKIYSAREHTYRRGKDKMPELQDVVPGAVYKCPVALRNYQVGVSRWMRHQQQIEGYVALPVTCISNEKTEGEFWVPGTSGTKPNGVFTHTVRLVPMCNPNTEIVIRGLSCESSYNLRFIKGNSKDER